MARQANQADVLNDNSGIDLGEDEVQESTSLRVMIVTGRRGVGANFGASGHTKDANAGLIVSAAFKRLGIPEDKWGTYAGCQSVEITKKGAASLAPEQFHETIDTAVTSLSMSEDEVRSAGQKERHTPERHSPAEGGLSPSGSQGGDAHSLLRAGGPPSQSRAAKIGGTAVTVRVPRAGAAEVPGLQRLERRHFRGPRCPRRGVP